MATQTDQYVFNVAAEGDTVLQQLDRAVGDLNERLTATARLLEGLGNAVTLFGQLARLAGRFADALRAASDPGEALGRTLTGPAAPTSAGSEAAAGSPLPAAQPGDAAERYGEAVAAANAAHEEAAPILANYAEQQLLVQNRFEQINITVNAASDGFGSWTRKLSEAIYSVTQLTGRLTELGRAIGKAITDLSSYDWSGMWHDLVEWVDRGILRLQYFNGYLSLGKVEVFEFGDNLLQAAIAVGRFATVGVWQGIKALGSFILSLVTTGGVSAGFAATASGAFAAFKLSAVTACRAVGIAIANIPIIGWIAAGIAALAALGLYFWNTSATFRAVLKGIGAAFVATFQGIWTLVKTVFGSIGDLIKAAFTLDGKGISDAIQRMKGGFTEFGSNIGTAFNEAYQGELKRSEEEKKAREQEEAQAQAQAVPAAPELFLPGEAADPLADSVASIGSHAAEESGGKIQSVHVTIERLVDQFTVTTNNLQEDAGRIKELVTEALVSAVNDLNYAL